MKEAVIVVSFGTSFAEVRKRCIEPVEKAIEAAFPEVSIRRAFTSSMIIRKIKEKEGIFIQTPQEAIATLISQGYKKIHVQPLHMIPGYEYEKIQKEVQRGNHHRGVSITLGSPMFSEEASYERFINIFERTYGPVQEEHAFLLMGHGTSHYANACYTLLQSKFNDQRSDVIIANVEGYPEIDQVMDRVNGYKKVTLMPLMLVAGDHAMNDMAGDEDSMKSVIEAAGIEAECLLKGLGELKEVQQCFVDRIKSKNNLKI